MDDGELHVLFLCARNAARSIMAEAMLNQLGSQRFRAYSAGIDPADAPHPFAMQVLKDASIRTQDLHSKGWREFTRDGAPEVDLVITMSDQVSALPPPRWPGKPVTVTWNFPDPVEAEGDEVVRKEAFRAVMYEIRKRIELMVSLPHESLERLKLQAALAGMAP